MALATEELLKNVADSEPCGKPDDATENQIAMLDSAVGRAARSGNFFVLRQAAEGLFRGGEIPDLGNREGDARKVQIRPVKDLRAAMALALAALETEGLPDFAEALKIIDGLLANHWEKVYPQANADDPEGEIYMGRVNALNPLCIEDPAKRKFQPGASQEDGPWRVEERLLKAVLLQSDRHGALTVRECLGPWAKQLKLTLPPGEEKSAEFIHEVRLAVAGPALDAQRQALQTAIAALQNISNAFKDKKGKFKPQIDYLIRLLKATLAVLEDKVESATPVVSGQQTNGPTPTQPANGRGGPISSREEALKKLLEVAEYFRRHEPASPIPQFLERVNRMAGMTFLALLEELKLGEQAVPEFRKLAGVREQTEPTGGAPKV